MNVAALLASVDPVSHWISARNCDAFHSVIWFLLVDLL